MKGEIVADISLKAVAEATDSPVEVMNLIGDLMTRPGGVVLLVLFGIGWLMVHLNVSRIFDFFERGESKKLARLDEYVAKKDLADPVAIEIMRDLRDAHYFKTATGIYADGRLRGMLINLHKSLPYDISWVQLRRAFPMLEFDDSGVVSVRFTWLDEISRLYNYIAGVAFLLGFVCIIAFHLYFYRGMGNLAAGIGLAFLVLFLSLILFSQNWPYEAARRIKRHLEKVQVEHQLSASPPVVESKIASAMGAALIES